MNRKTIIFSLALIFIIILGGSRAGTQTTRNFYVALNGNDANPGTAAKPWRTLQHAADQVRAGDKVFVKAGTYKEEVNLTRSGQTNAPITFAAAPQEEVTVQHFSLKKGVSHLRLQDFTISGFRIWGIEVAGDNHYLGFYGLKIKGGEAGVRLTVGHSGETPEYGPVSHLTMENCTIQGPLYAGVDCTPGPGDYLTFRRVEVFGAGQSGEDSYAADGISIEKGHHIIVENCYIHDNGGDGIDLNSRDRKGRVPGIEVRRNVVARNHCNGIKLWSGGLVSENLVWGQGDTPLTVGPYRGKAEIIYNTVAYNMWAREFGGRNYAATIGYPESGIAKPRVDLSFHHNIFAFNSGPAQGEPTGIYLGPGIRLLAEHHNLFHSFAANEIFAAFLGREGREFTRKDINRGVWAQATGQGKGDLTVTPEFVSGWPNVDLHLKSGSPAADRGAYAAAEAPSRAKAAPDRHMN
jgi:hypothetical protein